MLGYFMVMPSAEREAHIRFPSSLIKLPESILIFLSLIFLSFKWRNLTDMVWFNLDTKQGVNIWIQFFLREE